MKNLVKKVLKAAVPLIDTASVAATAAVYLAGPTNKLLAVLPGAKKQVQDLLVKSILKEIINVQGLDIEIRVTEDPKMLHQFGGAGCLEWDGRIIVVLHKEVENCPEVMWHEVGHAVHRHMAPSRRRFAWNLLTDEFEADAYAVSAGYGEGMLHYLDWQLARLSKMGCVASAVLVKARIKTLESKLGL